MSIFIRTYAGDAQWLEYCLLSLGLYAQHFEEVVIAVPGGEDYEKIAPIVASAPIVNGNLIALEDDLRLEKGYIDQQFTKLCADIYCRGNYIMHIDSDCIAQKIFNPGQFLDGNRPYLLIRKWEDAGTAATWRKPTEKCLETPSHFETMCALPIVHNRAIYHLLRQRIEEIYPVDFLTYMRGRDTFSEFNVLGNFALHYLPDWYSFVRAGVEDGFPRPLKQYWSHGGITPEIQAEIDSALNTDC